MKKQISRNGIFFLKKIQNSVSMFNTRLETAKEKISDLEDTAEEIMQDEVPRDKEMGNMRLQDHRTESEKV